MPDRKLMQRDPVLMAHPERWAADDHRSVEGAREELSDDGRVAAWVACVDGRELVVVPGATSWRFYIKAHDGDESATPSGLAQSPRYGTAISSQVYPSAQVAMDAARAWHAHPYLLP